MKQIILKRFARYFKINVKYLSWACYQVDENTLKPVVRIDGANAFIDISKKEIEVGIDTERFLDVDVDETEYFLEFMALEKQHSPVLLLKSDLDFLWEI